MKVVTKANERKPLTIKMKQTRKKWKKKTSKNVMHNYFKLCHQHICDITFNVSTHMIRATTRTIRYNRFNISMRFILVVLCDVVNSTGQNEEAKKVTTNKKKNINFYEYNTYPHQLHIMIQFSFFSFLDFTLLCCAHIHILNISNKSFFTVFIKQKLWTHFWCCFNIYFFLFFSTTIH